MGFRLSGEQLRILQALRSGYHLKVHRTLDGAKVYRLHGPGTNSGVTTGGGDSTEILLPGLVEVLERRGYVQSNLKFPAASLLLTERGMQAVAAPTAWRPVGPRGY